MAEDSFLRLISPAIRQALQRGSPHQRRAFAVACADFAIARLPSLVTGIGNLDDDEVRLLQHKATAAIGTSDARQVDERLRQHEDLLYAEICALRDNDASAPYTEFVRVSAWRHAVCALRAVMFPDTFAAAGRAAFEAICATREEDRITELACELCAG